MKLKSMLFSFLLAVTLCNVAVCSVVGEKELKDVKDNVPNIPKRYSFTHFISIPLNLNGKINKHYDDFKEKTNFADEFFISSSKLHITMEMLQIDESFKQLAIEKLRGIVERHLHLIPSKVNLVGLEVYGDSVTKAKVVYVNIENSEGLQKFTDAVRNSLSNIKSLVQFDSDSTVKFHCTLMNSKYAGLKEFDASEVMKNDVNFGEVTVEAVHLSIMHLRSDQTGFYPNEFKINLSDQ